MMTSPRRTVSTLALAALLAAGASPPLAGQEDTHRDAWQRVSDVAAALGAVPGAHVADIGAGGGYFTDRLQEVVGRDGRVYAVDISLEAVQRLRGTLDLRGVRNVDVVLGEPYDPRLPFGSLDGALIVNAYHEMTEYPRMLAAIRRALRPGGRLVILDNPPDRPESSRESQTGQHSLAIRFAAADLADAGFDVVRHEPSFIADTSGGHGHHMWLLVAERPLRDPQPQRLAGAPEGAAGLFVCPFPADRDELAERPSPPDSAETRLSGGRVKVCYSRPSIRGRVIMGGLVPFGEPWRTGANEATALRTDRPITVGTVRLEPGWYSLYTVPSPDSWEVVLNALPDRNGMVMDDWVRSRDIGRFTVPVERTAGTVDSLTIRFEDEARDRSTLVIEWERARVRVPVRPDGDRGVVVNPERGAAPGRP